MTTQSDDEQQSGSARQRLLDAADELFYAHGINATGVDAVITAADVARMTFYRHFRGKDDLVIAYLEGRDVRWRATLDEAIANAGTDSRAQLLAFFDALKTWHGDPRFRGCPFANAAAEFPGPDHPARAVVAAHKQAVQQRMTEIANNVPHTAPNLLVDQLMMLYEGATTTQALGVVTRAADKARATAAQLIYTG
ncbi:TetR/AcrR family transcriptional regulator [Saccharopolyspora sp. K220]|uniref:TetR/AcrR family transcriptional regulator n=1 Tax=Saccharopolyspora soli TaxID=2926618 RepID=UPI001F5AC85B|nr:TetR/AcrR family transcriptional regulator [Saccharopolyspora soli]MCI2416036.1 TetR/AcrR family transcriptional regulator [Saccharopolyspora soli]